MDWLSFQQAIADLNLELFLTAVLIALLFLGGLFFGRWSLRREMNIDQVYKPDQARQTWWNNFWQGISTELFGAFITTIGFGLILVVFQQYQAVQNDKADLILQMGSPDNAFAVEAVRIARQKGWLADGTLVNANLPGANLSNANLQDANLSNANLWGANLSNANLWGADLSKADLSDADLSDGYSRSADLSGANLAEADLSGINLSGANLSGINLSGANLAEADLSGTNLRETDLSGSYLRGADFSEADLSGSYLRGADLLGANLSDINIDNYFVLPDNTMWTSHVDMARFTDRSHYQYIITVNTINEERLRLDVRLQPIPPYGQ